MPVRMIRPTISSESKCHTQNPDAMDLQIRRAEPSDAEIVSLLGRITFAETFGYLFTEHGGDLRAYLDHTFSVAKIRASIGEEENRYWLSLVDDLPVGYAKLKHPSPTQLLPSENPAQLQKIYVLREFVALGIGKRFLDTLVSDVSARGIDALWLDVLKENHRAIAFYLKYGFVPIGDDTYTIGAQTFQFHLMALHGVCARH